MYQHTGIYIQAYMYNVHTYKHAYTIHVYMHEQTYICTYIYIPTILHAYIYMHIMYTCMLAYMCIGTCKHVPIALSMYNVGWAFATDGRHYCVLRRSGVSL